jgi:hypothetical protein
LLSYMFKISWNNRQALFYRWLFLFNNAIRPFENWHLKMTWETYMCI